MMTTDTQGYWTTHLVKVARGAALILWVETNGTVLWCVWHSGSPWPDTNKSGSAALEAFAGRVRDAERAREIEAAETKRLNDRIEHYRARGEDYGAAIAWATADLKGQASTHNGY